MLGHHFATETSSSLSPSGCSTSTHVSLALLHSMSGNIRAQRSVPQISSWPAFSLAGNGGWTSVTLSPRYGDTLEENGKEGAQRNGWNVAVKNGMVIAGSGGNTWTLRRGGLDKLENTKRARCFGIFQFRRPTCITLFLARGVLVKRTVI